MTSTIIHQFSETAISGDAITDQVLLIQQWLHSAGFKSEIYTKHCQPALENEVQPVSSYRRQREESLVIYHHAIGSTIVEWLVQMEIPVILIYHNITPPAFFSHANPALSQQLAQGREQLHLLKAQTVLALGDSDYNEAELREVGYTNTGVLPIVLNPFNYEITADPEVMALAEEGRRTLLFIGRVAPNKKQEDLIKLLYYYKRLQPDARLFLVGSSSIKSYTNWLMELASTLDLAVNSNIV